MKTKLTALFGAISLSGVILSGSAFAQAAEPSLPPAPASPWTITGHVDLVSAYYLRGLTTTYGNSTPAGNEFADAPESPNVTPQWGFDIAHSGGFYAGYWGSTINYSYEQLGKSYKDRTISDFQKNKSIENDFYAGYNGNVGKFGYTVGGTVYYYINGQDSTGGETNFALRYGDWTASAQTLLNDVIWGNSGDTYWSVKYAKTFENKLNLTATLGAYTYSEVGTYMGGRRDEVLRVNCAANEVFNVSGCYAGSLPISGGFRNLTLNLSRPIGTTGLTWNMQGIIAGDNRFGISQDSKLIASLVYGF